MPIHYSYNGLQILWFDDRPIKKYRPVISVLLKEKFGIKPSYEKEVVTEAMTFAFNWYCDKFVELITKEKSVRTYQYAFLLHEDSLVIHRDYFHLDPSETITALNFASYRRVLKLILEQACMIELIDGEKFDSTCRKRIEPIIEDLLYLGEFAYALSNLITDQLIQGDCRDLMWTEDELYYFEHKHHYGFLVDEFLLDYREHLLKAVKKEGVFDRLMVAMVKGFGIEYDQVLQTIIMMHNYTKDSGGKMVLHDERTFIDTLNNISGADKDKVEIFFNGLVLHKENKLGIREVILRPHKMERYFYRPILKWNLEGRALILIGNEKWDESIGSFITNAFGWNKFPVEWTKIPEFTEYIANESEDTDKVLENRAKLILEENHIKYSHSIKILRKKKQPKS